MMFDVAVDVKSSIFTPFFKAVSEESTYIEDQIEIMVVASEQGDQVAVDNAISKLSRIHKLGDLISVGQLSSGDYAEGAGNRKGPRQVEFYFWVSELINEKLRASGIDLNDIRMVKAEITSMFSESSSDYERFINSIESKARRIFPRYKDKKVNALFEEVKDIFVGGQRIDLGDITHILGEFNIDRLLVKKNDGNYGLVWDLTMNIYKPTNMKATRNLFSKVEFFIIDGQRKVLGDLADTQIENSWILVSDEDGKIGLALADKYSLQLPSEVSEEVIIDGHTVEGVFITDRSGKLVQGPAYLDSDSKTFKYQPDYKVAHSIQESVNSKTQHFFGTKFDKIFTFSYLRSLSWKTGSKITPFIQKVQSNIVPTGAHETIISFEKATKSLSVKKSAEYYESLLYNYDYDKLSRTEKAIVDYEAELFKRNLFFYVSLTVDTGSVAAYLPISDLSLALFGSSKGLNEEIIDGYQYFELQHIFKRLIPDTMVDYTDPANVVYRVFSLRFSDRSSLDLRASLFDNTRTRKQWFQDILTLLQAYQSPSDTPSSTSLQELDANLNHVVIDLFNNFKDKDGNDLEFDFNYHNKYFSKEDLRLASMISQAFCLITNRFVFQRMYTGGMMFKDGVVTFIRRRWANQLDVLKDVGIKMPVKYGRNSLDIPNVRSSLDLISRFYIDYYTQSFEFTLPVNPSDKGISKFVSLHQKYKSISFDALPMKLWLPMWTYPKLDNAHEKSQSATFLSSQLIGRGISSIDFSDWSSEGKVLLFDILKIKLEQEYGDIYRRKAAERALRYALTSVRLESRLEDQSRVRLLLYKFLTERGLNPVTIKFSYSSGQMYELTLTHDDYVKLFEYRFPRNTHYLDKIISSLEVAQLFDARSGRREAYIKKSLEFNEDPISEILDFFWGLTFTESGRRTILIYPQTVYAVGYATSYTSYYPGKDNTLSEWISRSAIVLEPGKTDSKRAALLIASLLIEGNLLVVRTPGMSQDEHLIAVDASGVIDPKLVKGSISHPRAPPVDGMKWSDFNEWVKLRRVWNRIISDYLILSIYYSKDPQDFYDVCKSISFIRDHRIGKT